MTTQAVSDLVQAAAPLDEGKVRAFMQFEAARYQPNFWWKLVDWANHNTWLVLTCFVAVMAGNLFTSGKPFGLDVMTDAFLVALVIVGGPFCFAKGLEKGPAQWYNSVHLCLDDERMAHMAQLREQYPGASCEVEVLQRTSHRRSLSLANVVWLVLPKSDGTTLRRGISAWAANPT